MIFVYFVRDLGMRMPLAAFFRSHAATEIQRRVLSVRYVEKTGILDPSPTISSDGRTP